MPVGLDCETMLRALSPQCDGIWRPPEAGIVLRSDGCQQHVARSDAEHEAQRAIAIVRIEPVVRRSQLKSRRHEHRLVSGAANLEVGLALILDLDFLVVELPGQEHPAVGGEELVGGEAAVRTDRPRRRWRAAQPRS